MTNRSKARFFYKVVNGLVMVERPRQYRYCAIGKTPFCLPHIASVQFEI
jgi:hypothetical protein